jgi:hypothetical protein
VNRASFALMRTEGPSGNHPVTTFPRKKRDIHKLGQGACSGEFAQPFR